MNSDLQQRVQAAASLAVLTDRSFKTAAGGLGLTTLFFGIGLVVSYVRGYSPVIQGYVYLEQTPSWPLPIGIGMIAVGVFALWAKRADGRHVASTWAYGLMSVIASVYGMIFIVGTAATYTSALIGPQMLYIGWAISAITQAVFSFHAHRLTKGE